MGSGFSVVDPAPLPPTISVRPIETFIPPTPVGNWRGYDRETIDERSTERHPRRRPPSGCRGHPRDRAPWPRAEDEATSLAAVLRRARFRAVRSHLRATGVLPDPH